MDLTLGLDIIISTDHRIDFLHLGHLLMVNHVYTLETIALTNCHCTWRCTCDGQ